MSGKKKAGSEVVAMNKKRLKSTDVSALITLLSGKGSRSKQALSHATPTPAGDPGQGQVPGAAREGGAGGPEVSSPPPAACRCQ